MSTHPRALPLHSPCPAFKLSRPRGDGDVQALISEPIRGRRFASRQREFAQADVAVCRIPPRHPSRWRWVPHDLKSFLQFLRCGGEIALCYESVGFIEKSEGGPLRSGGVLVTASQFEAPRVELEPWTQISALDVEPAQRVQVAAYKPLVTEFLRQRQAFPESAQRSLIVAEPCISNALGPEAP